MKILILFFFSMFAMSCHSKEPQNIIISKIHYKPNSKTIDTLWISQNDSTVFKREEVLTRNYHQTPKFETRYELKDPKNGVYYFIHNNIGPLVMEGRYDSEFTYEGHINKHGNFYNSKTYSYKKNGDLETIHYMEDGRNLKTEHYDRKKRLSKIRYIDKKSESTTKIEIYDHGILDKTRVYTSFDNYYTVKGATNP